MADHLFTIEGGRLRLHQHWGQTKAWDSLARIIAVVAGSQSGKTSWGPWWLNREIEICGGGDYLAVTSSFDLFKLKMLPEIRNVFEHVLGIGRYWSGDKVIELRDPGTGKFTAQRADDPMWGRIILRSAAAKGGLESSTAKAAWLDEAGQDEFTLDAYEAVRRRLTLHRGRILITTTPYNLGWLKQQIVDKADGKSIEVINFPSTVNPNFSQEEFDELRDTMPGWKFNMFMRGLYDRPPGMIFSDFKDEYRERGGHKVKPFELPKTWPRYAGIDPGVIHFCDVWIAYDSDNDIGYVYRESIRDRKSTKEHAEDMLTLARTNNERVVKWAVGSKSEIYHRDDFIAAGAQGVVEPEYADVEKRIDSVIARLRTFRLFIFDTCTGLLDQMGTYSRVVNGQGDALEAIKDKERFHFCLTADTQIATVKGSVPITQVKAGDLVLTRQGYRCVIVSGMTSCAADVLIVTFSDGTHLQGTGNHPVWVSGKGYTPLRALRYGDIMETQSPYQQRFKWATRLSNMRLLFTTAFASIATRTQNRIPVGITLPPASSARRVLIGFTGKSGKINTEISPTGITSTTKTETPSITISAILRLLRGASILSITGSSSQLKHNSGYSSILKTYDPPLPIGIDLMRGVNGIECLASCLGKTETSLPMSASGAEKHTKRRLLARTFGSALSVVRRHLGVPVVPMMKPASARCAEECSLVTGTTRRGVVEKRVLHVCGVSKKQPVFNLTVDGEHEYFANGVLTHNCDALGYDVLALPEYDESALYASGGLADAGIVGISNSAY